MVNLNTKVNQLIIQVEYTSANARHNIIFLVKMRELESEVKLECRNNIPKIKDN